MNNTLKEVFIKHSMAAIEGFNKDESIFGIDADDKMNICKNKLVSNYLTETYTYEERFPQIDLSEFAEDAKVALKELGINSIKGKYKIYVDDRNVMVIEGGMITLKQVQYDEDLQQLIRRTDNHMTRKKSVEEVGFLKDGKRVPMEILD